MKNPDKMSDRELRSEVKKWRHFGRNVLDQIHDWSTGQTTRTAYISEEREEMIKELVE